MLIHKEQNFTNTVPAIKSYHGSSFIAIFSHDHKSSVQECFTWNLCKTHILYERKTLYCKK